MKRAMDAALEKRVHVLPAEELEAAQMNAQERAVSKGGAYEEIEKSTCRYMCSLSSSLSASDSGICRELS